jgi:hypothetical protein
VTRLVAAALAAPVAPNGIRMWTVRARLTLLFDAQPLAVDALVLGALDSADPGLRPWLEPWALAPLDPNAALALWAERGEVRFGRCEVIRRVARTGITASFAVFQRIVPPDEADLNALLFAIGTAAGVDPRGTVAEVETFAWRNEYTRSRAYSMAAKGVAAFDPELAVGLVERIGDATVRAHTVASLVDAPSIAADAANRRWGLPALLALADPLYENARRTAFEAVARALDEADRPPTAVIAACLSLAANRDAETFDRCLPYLISAAYAAQPDDAARLVAELDTVAELITA